MYGNSSKSFWDEKLISAFTVAELGNVLPQSSYSFKIGDEWFGEVSDGNTMIEQRECRGNCEADARAKMLIYLLENKLIDIPH